VTVEAYFAEVELATGANQILDKAVESLKDAHAAGPLEREARRIAERLAVILQASLLVRHAPASVADAFCASRLGDDQSRAYGTLPAAADLDAIVARATPRTA
jgi:putative acyl-CoA dehydrogenase